MPIFTTKSEQTDYDNAVIHSKLANNIQVLAFKENGRSSPMVIANGCPIDFRTFNMIVTYYVGGQERTTEKMDGDLLALWESLGYAANMAISARALRPYYHAQERLLTVLGADVNKWACDDNILPALLELNDLLAELG